MNKIGMNGAPASPPVVDVQSICKHEDADDEKYLQVGKKIVEAFQEFGCVYLENTGIAKETMDALLEDMDLFFSFDMETKEKYHRSMITFSGYSNSKSHEYITNKKTISERDTFDFSNDPMFPDEVPRLRDSVPKLNKEAYQLIPKIIKSLELALDVPDKMFQKNHDFSSSENMTELRVLKYAPITDDAHTEERLEEHKDFTILTFQLYENARGLQVQDKNGKWHYSHPPPKTIMVFPGEILQMFTADKILATKHRVAFPETKEERQQHRHSIIYFTTPNNDVIIKPYDGSDTYAPIACKTFLYKAYKNFTNDWKEYEEYGQLDGSQYSTKS